MGDNTWGRLFMAVFVGCGSLAMASAVIAQEPLGDFRRAGSGARGVGQGDWVFVPPLRSVFQASRPVFDAFGLRLGNWVLSPELVVGGEYNDNVRAEEDDEDADVIGVVEPAFRLRSDWPVHLLGFEAGGRFERHVDETTEDREEARSTIFGRLDITRDDALFASATFRRDVQGRADPEDEGGDLTELNRWLGRVGYVHRFVRMNLRVNTRVQRFDFLNLEDEDRDRDELAGGMRLNFALGPRFTPFIQGGYLTRDFDDAVDDTGVNRDEEVYSGGLGGRLLITDVLLTEFSVDLFRTEFEDPSLDSFTALGLSGELVWNITRLTSIIAEAERTERATTQAGASSRIDTDVSIRLEHEVLRNLLVFTSAGYLNHDFQDIERTDDRFRAGVGGELLLNRNFSIFARYDFERRDSNVEDRDFTRNAAFVGARLQY